MSDSRCWQLRALDGHISQFYEDFVTGFLERMQDAKPQPLEVTHLVTKNGPKRRRGLMFNSDVCLTS